LVSLGDVHHADVCSSWRSMFSAMRPRALMSPDLNTRLMRN